MNFQALYFRAPTITYAQGGKETSPNYGFRSHIAFMVQTSGENLERVKLQHLDHR